MTTWYICGGLTFCVRLSSTTESPSSRSGCRTGGTGGITGDLVAMLSFYRAYRRTAASSGIGASFCTFKRRKQKNRSRPTGPSGLDTGELRTRRKQSTYDHIRSLSIHLAAGRMDARPPTFLYARMAQSMAQSQFSCRRLDAPKTWHLSHGLPRLSTPTRCGVSGCQSGPMAHIRTRTQQGVCVMRAYGFRLSASHLHCRPTLCQPGPSGASGRPAL